MARSLRPRTVASRLALGYGALIAVALCVLFLGFYAFIAADLSARTDAFLDGRARALAALLARGHDTDVGALFVREARSEGTRDVLYRLAGPAGKVAVASSDADFPGLGVDARAVRRALAGTPVRQTLSLPGLTYEVRVVYARVAPGQVLQAAKYRGDDQELLEDLRESFSLSLLIVLLFSGLLGWLMARRALAGVEAVTGTARAIAAEGSLDRRVPVRGRGDEIDRLAGTFNDMLDRIRRILAEMGEMTDAIAHDLKSPLTRMRGQAELALTGDGPGDVETLAAGVIEECDRLIGLIDDMLDLSEAEAGMARLHLGEVDLAAMAREAVDLFEPSADERGLTLRAADLAEVTVHGDARKLQRVLANLLDNALKYTPAGGTVEVGVARDGGTARLTVRDTGAGVAAEDAERIFDRFYRGDRARGATGSGLGLALARAVARAHGGDVTYAPAPGTGSVFTVTLTV